MADPILDKTKQGLAAFIRSVMNRVDFLAMYPCVIVTQNADSTLELKPDDARLPPLSSVPLRLGIPGCTVTVAGGSRALLGWYAGDPSKPFAALFEASTVTALNVTAGTLNLGGGTTQSAALGDQLTTALANISTWLTMHTHAGVTAGGASTAASVLPPPTIGTVKSSNVQVKT